MPTNKIKPSITRRLLTGALISIAVAGSATPALADTFPVKPIQLVIPAPPGGGTDGMARLAANALATSAGWKLVPDNRPGAGGNIGFDLAFRAPADGHTLAMGESSNMIVNQYLYERIPFDINKDMQPIALVAQVPLVLVVATDSDYVDVESLRDAGKKQSLSFASSGNGTLAHLVGELWKRKAEVDMLHIPYRGASPAITDLIGGQVDLFFASVPVALPMIQAGKVRALAVTAPSRIGVLKDIPTMAEVGYPDMAASVVFGLVGPSGIPTDVVERINTEVNTALAKPETVELLAQMGVEHKPGDGVSDVDSFSKLLSSERAKWAPIVKASGAKVD